VAIRRLALIWCAFVVAAAQGAARAQGQAAPVIPIDIVVVNPAAAPGNAGPDADESPQALAVRRQFEPHIKAELSLANRACQWTADERGKAIKAAVDFLRGYSREAVNQNGAMNQGMMLFVGEAPRGLADPHAAFDAKLGVVLLKQMTDKQREAYQHEREKRDAFVTEAVIDNIVAQMDERLELAPDQRRRIIAALRENWKDAWTPPLQLFVQMPQYVAAAPDEHVLPLLTPEQRLVWQGVQKISARGVDFGGGIFGGREPVMTDIDLAEGQ
jgi:hypothetical protein